MESLYLKTFLEVVRTGSISRAAENLFVTQPAVSRRLKFMEEQYGFPLLNRIGQSFQLTDAGRIVLEKAEKLLEIEGELLSGLRTLNVQKKIAFSCTPAFGIAHLPVILKDFMLEHSEFADLKFIFNMPDKIVSGVQKGFFDLALIEHCECFDLTDLTTYAMPGDDMIFVSSPALAIPSPLTSLEELLPYSLYTRNEGCCSRTLLDANLRRIGREIREFRSLVVYDDLHIIIRSVLEGIGISFLSRDLVIDHLQQGSLLEHRIEHFCHHRHRTLVMGDHPSQENSLLNHFVKAIFTHFNLPQPAYSTAV